MKKWMALLLCGAMLTGCGAPSSYQPSGTAELSRTVEAETVQAATVSDEGRNALTDFSLELLKKSMTEGNALVSPLSVLYALGMTANGAEGVTRSQMEEILGASVEQLNPMLLGHRMALESKENAQLNLANSIWIKNDDHLAVEQSFLQNNKNYYDAEIYTADFDEATRKKINRWVEEKTDGMIPEILSELKEEEVLCLINALAFEADWRKTYTTSQVREGQFTTEDGTAQTVDMMYGSEHCYLEDENAAGFVKYYQGMDYAFVALLPDEGVSVADYVASLSGESLQRMLQEASEETVRTSMPKFRTECSVNLKDTLKAMGMTDAFDEDLADFSGMGSYGGEGLYISRVIHKTFIEVAEQGTKASAATAVTIAPSMSAMPQEPPKEVYLDRPFIYLIVDCENQLPLFLGTLMSIE